MRARSRCGDAHRRRAGSEGFRVEITWLGHHACATPPGSSRTAPAWAARQAPATACVALLPRRGHSRASLPASESGARGAQARTGRASRCAQASQHLGGIWGSMVQGQPSEGLCGSTLEASPPPWSTQARHHVSRMSPEPRRCSTQAVVPPAGSEIQCCVCRGLLCGALMLRSVAALMHVSALCAQGEAAREGMMEIVGL